MPKPHFPMQRPGGAVGIAIERPNRNLPGTSAPITGTADPGGRVDRQSDISTYFTRIGSVNGQTPTLYNGDRLWCNVTLLLETAGPVAVGTRADLFPVLSGKGMLLDTGVPATFTIGKGTRLYIASDSVNRVKVELAPFPWIEQIAASTTAIEDLLRALASMRK